MTSLKLSDSNIPDLTGKVAIITGGASGIGLATARILANHATTVHVLDISPPHAEDGPNPPGIHFHICNVTAWTELREAFASIGHVDIAISNAGVCQSRNYYSDWLDASGDLEEPEYADISVNFVAVINFVKLALSAFKKQGPGGSLVITSSTVGLNPEQSIPVYSATKCGLLGLMRALRSTLPHTHGATINAVAPAVTTTRLLTTSFAAPIIAAGAPVSTAEHVGLAIVYSAIATQDHQVEAYGRDSPEAVQTKGRWNGRTIFTLGDTWTEVEEPLASLRDQWLGKLQTEQTAWQQRLTDRRPHVQQVVPEETAENPKAAVEEPVIAAGAQMDLRFL